MPRRLVTVSELVEICSPPSDDHRALWLRRAREWSAAGVLPPSQRHQQGSGRHRLYDFNSIYLAAVLFRMSDLGVPVGVLAQISRLIRSPNRTRAERDFRKFWRGAADLTEPNAYLAISPVPGDEAAYYQQSYGSMKLAEGAWAVINLSVTFAQLKL